MMTRFTLGQEVGILAVLSTGPFPDESLVSIKTPSGSIAGFAKKSDIDQQAAAKGYVRAVVRNVENGWITILIAGSYFTTAGTTTLPAEWAADNLALAEG